MGRGWWGAQFVGVVGQVAQDQQLSQLGQVLPSLSHQFAPLFAADHAVAMCPPPPLSHPALERTCPPDVPGSHTQCSLASV